MLYKEQLKYARILSSLQPWHSRQPSASSPLAEQVRRGLDRLSIKEFSGDDSSPQQTSIYHQYISLFDIYIYISYISHCQSEGNHPVSVEMFERKMLKKLYQKLSNEHSDGLGCLHFKVRGHWNLLDTPHVVLSHFQRRRTNKNTKQAP